MNFAIAASPTPASIPVQSASRPEHRKLSEAAQQFEGMLLEEMLKPMREHGFAQQDGEEDGGGDETGGSDTLSSFGTEAMANAIAKSGGLGIANRIVSQVEAEQNLRSSVPANFGLSDLQNKTVTVLKLQQTTPMN